MRNQTVVSGLRGAQNPFQRRDQSKPLPSISAAPSKNPNAMVFRAKASNYVFVISNPQETFNAVTGKRDFSAPIKRAKFTNYVLETADEEIIGRLVASPQFGLGRDFWLLEDEQKIQTTEAVQQLLTQLHALPNVEGVSLGLRQQLVQALGRDVKPEFVPPVAAGA